jgi:hypothetical protein
MEYQKVHTFPLIQISIVMKFADTVLSLTAKPSKVSSVSVGHPNVSLCVKL